MKIFVHTLLTLFFFSVTSAQATTCRSGRAATAGSQSGYERDKQATQQTAQNNRFSSDILGKCVGGITSVLTAPQFPNLSGIFDQIKNKACKIASDQVNGAVNGVNSQINGVINDVNGQIHRTVNDTGISQVYGAPPPISAPSLQQTHPESSDMADFWRKIWN